MTSASSEPLDILNASMTATSHIRAYFGQSKTTANCGQIAFYYSASGSTANYTSIGVYGYNERLVIHQGVGQGTVPGFGCTLSNQFRTNLLEVATSIILKNGANTTTITSAVTSNYNFILPTTVGTAGQVLTSQAGATMTWTSVGTGSVTSVAMTVPAILSVSGSPITTSGYM
jgi:hypothetical protein